MKLSTPEYLSMLKEAPFDVFVHLVLLGIVLLTVTASVLSLPTVAPTESTTVVRSLSAVSKA
ncbi:gsl3137 [Gloeobacter violaceus PCC 7421]|uniref:Gsl3137 protein n=2 Tax=Gloeobacter violaceus TaxID=33072 RepID=Q7NGN1_GLOVI|nr:gsl3137 [Gloeobacter violaceus PCC 7421]